MTNTFIAINRGTEGFKFKDFTIGAASTAGDDFELRIATVDGQGHTVTKLDVIKALKAFERAILNGVLQTTFPPL